MNEFNIIDKYFAKNVRYGSDVILGIGDDAAIISPPSQQNIVVTTDTFIENVHFVANTNAYDIGFKSLAVNLSDLAAMGAIPAWLTLALTIPTNDEEWLAQFAKGFFTLANQYQAQLIGGDLTKGNLSITITAMGLCDKKFQLSRANAQPDDIIFVTGKLGEPGLALQTIFEKKSLDEKNAQEKILTRLNRPEPRITIGRQLLGIANACIDISDGLIQDLNHILQQSHVGADVNVDIVPISPIVRQFLSAEEALAMSLNTGDEYELCFTVPEKNMAALEKLSKTFSVPCTAIGKITKNINLNLHHQNGKPYHGQLQGFKHF